jgi:hypothetical protein
MGSACDVFQRPSSPQILHNCGLVFRPQEVNLGLARNGVVHLYSKGAHEILELNP